MGSQICVVQQMRLYWDFASSADCARPEGTGWRAQVRLKLRCAEHDLAAFVHFADGPIFGCPCPSVRLRAPTSKTCFRHFSLRPAFDTSRRIAEPPYQQTVRAPVGQELGVVRGRFGTPSSAKGEAGGEARTVAQRVATCYLMSVGCKAGVVQPMRTRA